MSLLLINDTLPVFRKKHQRFHRTWEIVFAPRGCVEEANADGRSTFASLACNAPGEASRGSLHFSPITHIMCAQAGVSSVLTSMGPLLDCERRADGPGCDQQGRCGRHRPHAPFRTCAVVWMTSSSGGRCVALEREQSFNPLGMTTMAALSVPVWREKGGSRGARPDA